MDKVYEVLESVGVSVEEIEDKVYFIEVHLGLPGYEWVYSMLDMVEDEEHVNEIISTIEDEKLLIEEEERDLSREEINSLMRRKEEEKFMEEYERTVKTMTRSIQLSIR